MWMKEHLKEMEKKHQSLGCTKNTSEKTMKDSKTGAFQLDLSQEKPIQRLQRLKELRKVLEAFADLGLGHLLRNPEDTWEATVSGGGGVAKRR